MGDSKPTDPSALGVESVVAAVDESTLRGGPEVLPRRSATMSWTLTILV